ncbi:MAG TPA: hypothetical protein VIL69_24130 [Roseomonas sp.]
MSAGTADDGKRPRDRPRNTPCHNNINCTMRLDGEAETRDGKVLDAVVLATE